MRLAICLEQCLAPVPGGTGRYSRELAAALARTAPDGSVVHGWTAFHREHTTAVVPGVHGPFRLPLPRRALIAAWERGLGPSPRNADIVHAPTLLLPPRNKALVVTIHDTVPWTHPETLTPRGVMWHRRMAQHAERRADLVVVPTEAVANELAERLPGLADRLVLVGEGVSPSLVLGDDAETRARRLQLPASYLLTLATLEPRKGLDTLLASLSHVPTVPLVVVGQPGWGGVDPYAEAASAGVSPDRLRVLGRLSDPDLAVVLDRATALVAPSRAEGFGLPVLEAMAAGTPVISSDAPALVEVGGGATVVVPRDSPKELAEAISELIDNPQLRTQLAASGRQRAALYTWDCAAEALWGAYHELGD